VNLKTVLYFLAELYNNPRQHNLSRLEHEAIRRAIATIESLILLEGDTENSDNVEEEE